MTSVPSTKAHRVGDCDDTQHTVKDDKVMSIAEQHSLWDADKQAWNALCNVSVSGYQSEASTL